MKTGHARSTRRRSLAVRVAVVFALLVATGCVDRRFIIESNVPNAQVYIDNQPVGAAPAHASFEYYGYYNITIIQPGYETINQRVHVTSPWYGYPPFDFLTEVLWPFHIHDTRRYYFELHEITKTRVDDLINNADALRDRGHNLPLPKEPAATKLPPGPIVQPQPGPTVLPLAPSTGPQAGSVAPPVGPQASPLVPSVGPGADSNVPSVLPGLSGRP